MKKCLLPLIALFALVSFISCNENAYLTPPSDHANAVLMITIDYTSNTALRSFTIPFPKDIESLVLEPEYKEPSDFGHITWTEATSGKTVFAGTIIWMGKGEQTYPKGSGIPASELSKNDKLQPMPDWRLLVNQEIIWSEDLYIHPDYDTLWPAISQFEFVQQCYNSNPSEPFYIYLYQPSVGMGDPKDWYWVVFMHYNKNAK